VVVYARASREGFSLVEPVSGPFWINGDTHGVTTPTAAGRAAGRPKGARIGRLG
jgi:hypothetical protein